jgi:hypothetical protein
LKIKFNCNWTDDKSIYDRVIANYIGYETPEITYKDDYTHLVVFNKMTCEQKCPSEDTFAFIMEPSWSENWDRNLGIYSDKVFFHDLSLIKDKVTNLNNYIEHPSFMMHHMLYSDNINYFLNSKFDKNNLLSFVVSCTPNNSNYLYGQRTDFAFKLLSTNLDFHIYGNNWPILDQRIKGPVFNKKDALIDYKYSIAIENSREKNYVTEKFIDCFLCDTIPIYYGCPNINEIYNEENFISLSELSIECLLENLKTSRVFNLKNLKEIYNTKYNIFNIIKNLI